MKICAIICEFNPFHNGHKYLLEQARKLSGCDFVLCIMSGDFTQRGEICILDKYTRAKHAVLGGVDCVIQLPASFAVAPAEVFAKGAVKILSAIPSVTTLAFGCESGSADDFRRAANIVIDENVQFKNTLNKFLDGGESYIKSYSAAFAACGGDVRLTESPNNVLGLEYTKALARSDSDIGILTIKRIGAGYNDGQLKDDYSSAGAIRNNLSSEKIKTNLPDYVLGDLDFTFDLHEYESFLRGCLFRSDTDKLKRVYGCGEGLENKLKSLENQPLEVIVEKATSRRYTSSRIRRILCANALNIYSEDTKRFYESNLYIKPLAVKKQSADEILAMLSQSAFPVVTGINGDGLSGIAKECFEKDKAEFDLYNFITKSHKKDYMITI